MSNKQTKDISGLEYEDVSNPIRNGHNYLLAIGIDDYQNYPKLNNAVKDTKEFVALLHKKYQFSPEYTTTLYDELATEDNIEKEIDLLIERVTPNDNLILYYSGHGFYHAKKKEGYWIPVDAREGKKSDFISNANLKKSLDAIQAHHIFLIVDSCFSGSLFLGTSKGISKIYENKPSRWGLSSGGIQPVSDGKKGENSPFAASILSHLRQNTESIGVQQLCSFVIGDVPAHAGQEPIGEPLRISGHRSGGQFVFHPKEEKVKAKKIGTNTLKIPIQSTRPIFGVAPGANLGIPKSSFVLAEPENQWITLFKSIPWWTYAAFTIMVISGVISECRKPLTNQQEIPAVSIQDTISVPPVQKDLIQKNQRSDTLR